MNGLNGFSKGKYQNFYFNTCQDKMLLSNLRFKLGDGMNGEYEIVLFEIR